MKKSILNKTLSYIDKPYEDWKTYNDRINTTLFLNNEDIEGQVKLEANERPLLECILEKSYLLISNKRIISIIDSQYNEMMIGNIKRFGNEYEKENFKLVKGKHSKLNTISIYDFNGKKLIYLIDSLYPAYFSKILIQNLIKCYHSKDWP